MTTKEKIQSITNYEEKVVNKKNININYIDMISDQDELYLLEQKRKKRELTIDVILGEKEESELCEENIGWIESDNNDNISTLTPKIFSVNLKATTFKSYDDILDIIIDFLDKNSNKPKKNGRDVTLKNENFLSEFEKFQANSRRISATVNLHANLIAINSRIGPGEIILTNPENLEYFDFLEKQAYMTMPIIYNEKITKNKVIIARSGDISSPGIILVDDSKNGTYFLKETMNWENKYSWFWIK